MIRIAYFPPAPEESRTLPFECACCGARYTVKRRGMRLFGGGTFEGEICPECVLAGPAGAAAKVRGRMIGSSAPPEGDTGDGKDRGSWVRRLESRAILLDEESSFPLAARQAAVRETRERR